MDIQQLRSHINEIDAEIIDLFVDRMQTSSAIAQYKRENNLPVRDPAREREVLDRAARRAGEEFDHATRMLFNTLFDLSRAYQSALNAGHSPLSEKLQTAAEEGFSTFPRDPQLACFADEESSALLARNKLFAQRPFMRFDRLDDLFRALEHGQCDLGVVTTEGSAGAMWEVYDLLQKYRFSIVRSIRLADGDSSAQKDGPCFACVSRDLKIFPNADRISFMLSLPNIPGALYRLLSRFAAMDMNLLKIESRPVSDNRHEIQFLIEAEATITDESTRMLISDLASTSCQFAFLGNYSEIH